MRTVSVGYFKSYYDACLKYGGRESALLKLIPGGKAALQNPADRLPIACLFDVLEQTEHQTGLKNIGLLAGQNIRPESFRETGQAIMFSRSLREAAHVNHRYQPLSQQIGRTVLKVEGENAMLYWHPFWTDFEKYRQVTEAVMTSHAQFTRWLTWQHELQFTKVYFRHKAPEYAAEYQSVFRCPVVFAHSFDAISNQADIVDTPLPQANPELFARTCKTLNAQLEALERPKSAAILVKDILENSLDDGPPSLNQIAERLGISVRSLRRRLADEHTSYRGLLDSVRQNLCERYFLEGGLSLAEISSKLGYSEQSAFNRAFLRWHGTTPKTYRQAMGVFSKAFDQMAP